MRPEDVQIHTDDPDELDSEFIGFVKVRVGATPWSSSPTLEDVNHKLRERAIQWGANAVIKVTYQRGFAWRSLTASGVAVNVLSDETTCPYCAETIKAEAIRCRHCGSDLTAVP